MHSSEFEDLLLLADAGELEAASLARLAAHEPGCASCAELRAALAEARAAARRAAVSLPEWRLDSLAARVTDGSPAPVPARRSWLPRLLAAGALAGLAALALRLDGRRAPTAADVEGGLTALQGELDAAERAWGLEETSADIDTDLRGLQESTARLAREVGGADGRR